ncbi:methyltransferase domain-containing protein [Rhodotorula diobovata]|uniref:Alpha N-terminal protein methyltransferase 1 n=1 Tax=Rhodotorula diobovata TaxID=5288 RepID=A0A5C5G3J9_9BASI|nr:methyltransferase domain-containing protein [Rhodotorula diobovata]
MASQHDQVPDFDRGVAYWAATDAGTPVPRLDATSSRLLILSLLPSLSTIPPPHLPSPSSSSSSPSSPTKPPRPSRPFRALDCGAGIGRVTRDTLLPLFDAVDLVEPVPAFVAQAERDARAGRDGWRRLAASAGSEGQGQGQGQRAVRIWKAGLQHFDPRRPAVPVVVEEASGAAAKVELAATIGRGDFAWPDPHRELDLAEAGYDLVRVSGPLPRRSSPASLSGAQTDPGWCQWCLGHLSDPELVSFLRRARAALRTSPSGTCEGFIVVKENVCADDAAEGAGRLFDDEDSSITRSDRVWRDVFDAAGLEIVRREVQLGFPQELFPVVAYALR